MIFIDEDLKVLNKIKEEFGNDIVYLVGGIFRRRFNNDFTISDYDFICD